MRRVPEDVRRAPPEEEKKEKEVKEGEEQAEEPPSVRQQILVMWGNTLFEHSQMAAKQSKPFQPLLDEAIAKFNEAGCQKADVDQALKVHRGCARISSNETKSLTTRARGKTPSHRTRRRREATARKQREGERGVGSTVDF